jgi:hypothetical protein
MVTAKFRVMERKEMWNGECTVIRLLPVTAKAKPGTGFYVDPEGSEENAAFWDATPSGEAELVLKGFDTKGYAIGSCVKIHMEQLAEEPPEDKKKAHWKLEAVKSSYSLSIELRRSWQEEDLRGGVIKMDIANEGAWPPFQGNHLTHWNVTFEPAKG